MVHLHTIKPRIPRLRKLVAELIQDVLIAKTAESPLLDGERRAYLIGIQEAIAGLDEASVVLGKAVKRIEELGLPSELR
jgi:hypothetical protein